MFQKVKAFAAEVAALPGRAWARAEAWLVAHRQGFEGFVLGLLVAGLVVARIACQSGK
jgi:hypothetical protein